VEKADKRREIMEAALELIVEKGFRIPMSEIARKAEVGAGTIYRYFVSKDVLITQLHQDLEDRILQILKNDYPTGKPIKDRFLYVLKEIIKYFMANPLHFRYMEQFYNSPYGATMRRDRLLGIAKNKNLVMDIFLEGVERNIFKDMPIVVIFALAFGPLITLIRDHILGFIVLDDKVISCVTEACWDAIKR